jgi:cyclophilin family peptidyl-prolyl cis-trans isomerase
VIETNKGDITVELNDAKAPVTVKNFLRYVDEKFYDGTVFHRVIKTFVIQGGGLTPDMTEKPTHEPIVNEAINGLSNLRGTIAMARTSDINSATSQFDHQSNDSDHYGYAVFGKVIDGLNVVDAIANVPTHSLGDYDDVPIEPIVVSSIHRKVR